MLKYWIVRLRSYCDKICTRPAVVMVGKADRFSFVAKCESRIVLFRQFCRSPLLFELNAQSPTARLTVHTSPTSTTARVPRPTPPRLTVHTSPTSTTARVPRPTPPRLTARTNPTIYALPPRSTPDARHRTVYSRVDPCGQPWGGAANLGVLGGQPGPAVNPGGVGRSTRAGGQPWS